MKATINGVTVEGTPQEIAEYAKLVGEARGTTTLDARLNVDKFTETLARQIRTASI